MWFKVKLVKKLCTQGKIFVLPWNQNHSLELNNTTACQKFRTECPLWSKHRLWGLLQPCCFMQASDHRCHNASFVCILSIVKRTQTCLTSKWHFTYVISLTLTVFDTLDSQPQYAKWAMHTGYSQKRWIAYPYTGDLTLRWKESWVNVCSCCGIL